MRSLLGPATPSDVSSWALERECSIRLAVAPKNGSRDRMGDLKTKGAAWRYDDRKQMRRTTLQRSRQIKQPALYLVRHSRVHSCQNTPMNSNFPSTFFFAAFPSCRIYCERQKRMHENIRLNLQHYWQRACSLTCFP